MLPLIVLVGATASGKSSLAVKVARALTGAGDGAEVVNADSMLVYRGMDVGTAKPSAAERHGVVHHLIDIMDVTETASVADFQTLARDVIADCRDRGVVPILVGGSALYTRAIVDQFSFPGTDAVVRARWQARLEEVGAESLHAELARLAPDTASGILPGNARRVVRALEVIELTGGYTPQLPAWTYELENVHQFGLQLPRDVMDARIEARVHEMWASGFVEEVRHLEALGLRQGVTAARALGYRQVLAMLDGSMTEAEAQKATIAGTRRFARKQLGWYSRDDRITWLDAGDAGNVARILDRIAEASTEMTTSVEE